MLQNVPFSCLFIRTVCKMCVCLKHHAACRISRCVSPGHFWPGESYWLIFKDASAQCNETNPIWNVGCRKLYLMFHKYSWFFFFFFFFSKWKYNLEVFWMCFCEKQEQPFSENELCRIHAERNCFCFWQKENLSFFFPRHSWNPQTADV